MIGWALLASLAAQGAPAAPKAASAPLLAEAARQVAALESFVRVAAGAEWPNGGWYVAPEDASDYCLGSSAALASMPLQEVEFESACDAFVQGDIDVCRGLRPSLAFSRQASVNCTRAFADLTFSYRVAAPNPASDKLCREGIAIAFAQGSTQDDRSFCDVLASGEDIGKICAGLRRRVPGGFPSAGRDGCPDDFDYLLNGENCARFRPDEFQHGLCPAFSSFRRARTARSPALCGDDFLCRALMGDREACANRRRAWMSSYCARTVVRRSATETSVFRRKFQSEMASVLAEADDMLLDDRERGAMRNLHDRMLALKPIDSAAADDVFLVRTGRIDDLLYRAGALLESPGQPGAAAQKTELARLERRFAAARRRYESLGAARARGRARP